MRLNRLLILVIALAAAGVQAQPLAVQQQNGMRFVAGGVGLDEREVLNGMRADFNVRLTFAVKGTGAYVADVDVVISDAKGASVLKTLAPGPKLYAQLAPGRYTLTTTFAGTAQTKNITVGKTGSSDLIFYWDDPSAREPGALK